MSSSLKNKVAQNLSRYFFADYGFYCPVTTRTSRQFVCGNGGLSYSGFIGGEYVEDTCEVSINGASSAESVSLPTLSTSKLNIDGAEAGNQAFQIALKLCPANRSVDLRFTAADSSRIQM